MNGSLDTDVYCGDTETEQPDWRYDDPDSEIDDDDDPTPIDAGILADILGATVDEIIGDVDSHVDRSGDNGDRHRHDDSGNAALDSGQIDDRFDAVLGALEKSLGL